MTDDYRLFKFNGGSTSLEPMLENSHANYLQRNSDNNPTQYKPFIRVNANNTIGTITSENISDYTTPEHSVAHL